MFTLVVDIIHVDLVITCISCKMKVMRHCRHYLLTASHISSPFVFQDKVVVVNIKVVVVDMKGGMVEPGMNEADGTEETLSGKTGREAETAEEEEDLVAMKLAERTGGQL